MNRRYWFARHFAPKVYWSPDAGGEAGGEAGGTSATSGEAGGANPQAPAGAQTFTLEEVTKLIQSEADKRVTQALKKQQAEFERRAQLSGLNDSERALAEKDDEIEKLNAQLRDLNGYKAKAAVLAALSEAHLPATFADVITIDPDPEAAQVNAARVKALSDAFTRAVEAAVTQRLTGGRAPAAGGSAPAMTREQYQRLSLNEKQALAVSDPETYAAMNE